MGVWVVVLVPPHDKNNNPNPQTSTPHKHLTTLEGGATAVRATSHARVGGRAEISVGGRDEVRRGLGRARVRRAPAGPLRSSVNTYCPRRDVCVC